MQISLRTPTKKYSLITSMALAVGLLAGCASTFKPATPEDIVGKRAQQRVELLTEKKIRPSLRIPRPFVPRSEQYPKLSRSVW